MSRVIEITVPDIGDFSDIPVIELAVAAGDSVEEGDTLLVLESDKSTLEVPAEVAGKVVEVKVKEDDLVSEGSLLLTLEVNTIANSPASTDDTHPEPAAVIDLPESTVTEATSIAADSKVETELSNVIYASPSIRRYARQLGVDISSVKGTGQKDRVTREDIESFVKTTLSASSNGKAPATLADLPDWPSIDHEKFGPIERIPLSRIGRISGPALARNAMLIPHVTNFDKADITELEKFRLQLNTDASPAEVKVTILTFAVKAVVAALKKYPKFNSSLDGEALVTKGYWNIGVAADTPEGLLVPVIKSADNKGFRDIAAEMNRLATIARSGKLAAADMQGGTFTISSLGGIGGTNFTPIINAPEVAILGLPRAEIQPVWDGESFQPRFIQPLSLSFDHRVVDGVAAAKFLAHVAAVLTDLRRISV